MNKIIFILASFFVLPVWALVAPEKYMADPSCPADAPFKHTQWHNYDKGDGGYYTPYGECISCDTTQTLMLINEKDCNLCPNRTATRQDAIKGWISTNYCRLKQCPPNKPFYEENWNWSGCKSCQDNPKHIKKQECEQCPDMRWVEGAGCAPDRPDIMYYNGTVLTPDGHESHLIGGSPPYAVSCTDRRRNSALKTSSEECARCPDTYMKNGWCYFK